MQVLHSNSCWVHAVGPLPWSLANDRVTPPSLKILKVESIDVAAAYSCMFSVLCLVSFSGFQRLRSYLRTDFVLYFAKKSEIEVPDRPCAILDRDFG